jgi:hypothetical protein
MKRTIIKATTLHTIFKRALTIGLLSAAFAACSKNDNSYNYHPEPPGGTDASVLATAGDSATVAGTINEFRGLLGDSLNTTPGKTSGRREVNWDAVPPKFTNNASFPGDFFNSTVDSDPVGRKRGLVMLNTGNAFRVDSTDFSEIDASYAKQFETFSKKRLFTTIGTNVTMVTFKVPGTATDAFVKGFGVVFSDVDKADATTVEYFSGNTSLGVYNVPVHPASGSFSFVGVQFKDAKVTSVKITSGNGVLAAGMKDITDGDVNDLVVMDDFLYSEPIANQ